MNDIVIPTDNINKELVKDKILTPFFIEGNPRYLSTESIGQLNKYIDNDQNREITKNVWGNVLIDAITILKINDSREKTYEDFQSDSNARTTRFEEIFSNIRKTNTFGIEELRKYLTDFVDFESMLYGADNYYRDHMNHVFQVWAIGWALLEKYSFVINDGYEIDKSYEFHFEIPKRLQNRHRTISKSELWAMWTIIALCHDLGYPIEKSFKINQKTRQIISHFGSIQFTELDYNFSILNTFLVEKFLNIVSSKVVKCDAKSKLYETSIQTKFRDKFSKSLEDYKHGVFSSLLLFKDLTYFLETDYYIKEPLKNEDARQFYIRKEILRSISMHTCPKLYHINLNTLSFLLILCDELQEWNRPSFENIVNHHSGTDPQVKITKFDISSTNQSIGIEMAYEDFDKSKKKEYIDGIKRRFRNINYLFRGAKDDGKRKIQFEWKIKLGRNAYVYKFDSSKTSFDQLRITPKGFDIYQPR